MVSNSPEGLPQTTFWRLIGVVVLGGVAVVLLTPLWTLPFGRASLVVQGPPGDRYTTHYTSERPIEYENLSRTIPYMEGWTRYNATEYIHQTEYLEPKGQALYVYRRNDTSVHLMLVWSNKMADLHIPSVCYTYQGYKVLSEKAHKIQVLDTSESSIHLYVNELWTRKIESGQTREVLYFLVKYGLTVGGRETYLVRIECIDTPQQEARRICDEFARQIFLNIIDFYGVESAFDRGPTVFAYILSLGFWATSILLVGVGIIIVVFSWLPTRLQQETGHDERSDEPRPDGD